MRLVHSLPVVLVCLVPVVLSLSKIEQHAVSVSKRSLPANSKAILDESNRPKSRKKRSLIFPTGSDLEFRVSVQIPISALSATSEYQVQVPIPTLCYFSFYKALKL